MNGSFGWLAAGAASVVLALSGCSSDPVTPTGAATGVAAVSAVSPSAVSVTGTTEKPAVRKGEGSAPSRPQAPAQPARSDIGSVKLPAVQPKKPVEIKDGVRITVTDATKVKVVPRGPGEIAGPGVAVRISIENGSDSPVNLSGVAVNASVGDVPASPSDSDPAAPFVGELMPGKSSAGVYVFRMPEGATGQLTVQVEQNESKNVVVVKA